MGPLLSTAVMQKEHRGVTDPEQAWILGELIRYLEHPRSGALEFDDMGATGCPFAKPWPPALCAPATSNFPKWCAVRRAAALHRAPPRPASRHRSRTRAAAERTGRACAARREAHDEHRRGRDADRDYPHPSHGGSINLTADLRAGRITCSIDIDAPKEGRATTRVNWLIRQLKAAPDNSGSKLLRWARAEPGDELLSRVREDPNCIIADAKKDLRTFRVEMSTPMGIKRGVGQNAFINSVVDLMDGFYGDVVQHLKAWSAAPPKLRTIEEPPEGVQPALVSTALSSQDGGEPAGDAALGTATDRTDP